MTIPKKGPTAVPVIDTIEAIPFRIPLRKVVKVSFTAPEAAESVLIRVRDSDGVVGVSEAIPHPMFSGETQRSVVAIYDSFIRPRLEGNALVDIEALSLPLKDLVGNPTARAALDMALTDLHNRRHGVGLYSLTGSPDGLPVSATLGTGEPADVAQEAEQYAADLGVTAFKIKVGKDPVTDAQVCRAVRAIVGDDALLYADANHGFDGLEALRFLDEVSDAGLAWIEEPCPSAERIQRELVAQHGHLPVLGDESCSKVEDVAREVLDGRSHLVNLKVSRSGYTTSEVIRGFCEAMGVPLVMGSLGESDLGTLSCFAYASAHRSTARYPAEYSYFLHLTDGLLVHPPEIVAGRLHVHTGPDAMSIDEQRLGKCRVD